MKVAVISPEQMSGKSAFIATLAGVYSRSQHQDVAILSTGDAADNIEIVDTPIRNDDITNVYVFKSIVQTSDTNDKSLLNYGIRQGGEHVYIYNIMANAMEQEDKEELFLDTMNKLPTRLTLVEIATPIDDKFTQSVIMQCDCILILIDTSLKSFRTIGDFVQKLPEMIRGNIGYVISKSDQSVASDKAIEKITGIKIHQLYKFPYSPVVAKLAFNGELDRIAYNIVVGDFEVTQFRVKMQEIMEFIFDSGKRKIIRSIDKWYR